MDQRRIARLEALYESLRRSYLPDLPPAEDGLPATADIEAVERVAVNGHFVSANFFHLISVDGALERAILTTHRRRVEVGHEPGLARSVAQSMQHYDDLRPIADICLAVSALREPIPSAAWTLLTRNDLAFVLRHAPIEYFSCGFDVEPEAAAAALDKLSSGVVDMTADTNTWLEVASLAFAAGYERQCGYALDRAEAELGHVTDPTRNTRMRTRIDVMRSWLGRAESALQPVTLPEGQVAFAVVDYRHPDWRVSSDHARDLVESLTVLAHLARHAGAGFAGESGLTQAAERLRTELPAAKRVTGEALRTVHLTTVDRDLDNFATLPEDTWTVVTNWFAHPLSERRFQTPFHPRLRPLFISFHIEEPALARPGVVDYLREHGPVGCRDWATVHLLQAANVPAFFSGAITTTTGAVVGGDGPRNAPTETIWFDTDPQGAGHRRTLHWHMIRSRTLAENLQDTADTMRHWRQNFAKVVTSDLRISLAARSLGAAVDFRPEHPQTSETTDLGSLSDGEFAAMSTAISEKLSAALGAVLAGRPPQDVYETWRAACAADVAEAEALTKSVADLGTVDFDLHALCAQIRATSVTVERSVPAGSGTEINVELSLDANYKPKLDIVLDSIVAHTDRPVRAFILCREHGAEDFERMARLFPMVSFVWLPTDDVDYGPIAGKVPWASLVTMDRTLLPLILPEVDRIMHLDLDLLCVGDVGELFDTPDEGRPLVAALEPQLRFRSGYDTVRRTANRLRSLGTPELATELTSRVVARHPFDFDVFNAGVMVMNLDKMRTDDFCGRFLPYVQRYGVNGQEVLNIYVGDDFVRVDPRWNINIRLEVLPDDARIVHWAGPFKPWRKTAYVTGREIWQAAEERFRQRISALEPEAVPAIG